MIATVILAILIFGAFFMWDIRALLKEVKAGAIHATTRVAL